MRRIVFSDVDELCDLATEKFGKLISSGVEYPIVEIFANFYEAHDILRCLVCDGWGLDDVKIAAPWYEYDKEYCITITSDGVSCSEAWHEENDICPEGYLFFGGDYSFVHEDCNSKLLKFIETDAENIVEFAFEDEEDIHPCDKCDGHCYDDDEDNIVVKVNGEEVHGDEAEKYLKEILLDYCDWMDAYNERLARMNYVDNVIRHAFR